VSEIAAQFGPSGYTLVDGDDIPHLGMMLGFDRVGKCVTVTQRKFVDDLIEIAGVKDWTPAKKPCGEELFTRPESEILSERERDVYRSLCMSLLYAATRTYPECLPVASVLAGRFVNATQDDMTRLRTAISYMGLDPQHGLRLRPTSMSPVASADSAYAVHLDGKSHTGIAIGFEGIDGNDDCYIAFGSGKDARVAKSSCESELMAANRAADSLMWMVRLLSGFGINSAKPKLVMKDSGDQDGIIMNVPVLYQDNKSAITIAETGKGNFKNTKHIRVRYYYISDLIRSGELVIKWIPTQRMVADVLTKGVTMMVFTTLVPMLLGKQYAFPQGVLENAES
jgi:hypothetical protein